MISKKFNRLTSLIFAAVLLAGTLLPFQQASAQNDPLAINASAAILVEASTGKILYGKNIDEQLPIASMAKVMTEYLVLEAVNEGRLNWDQTYTPSNYVYRISQNRGLSNVPLREDGTYQARELFDAMAIYSANGAAIGLAEMVSGSETNFVKEMNEKAKELGLTQYKFVNATGLDNKDLLGVHPEGTDPDGENTVSARDMAILSSAIVTDFPEILETASTSRKVFREGTDDAIKMDNWNWMLPGLLFETEGVDGLKTGSTKSAGSSFTSTAERNGMRVVTVVMNAKDDKGSLHTPRFNETKKLLDYAYNNFTVEELFPQNYQDEAQTSVTVDKGKQKTVELETKTAYTMAVKRGEKENYQPKFQINEDKLNDNGDIAAPVEKGEALGYMTVEYTGGDTDYGFLSNSSDTQLVAKESVEKANWFVLSMRGVTGFFGGLWNNTVGAIKGLF